jgi:hypothetical protein
MSSNDLASRPYQRPPLTRGLDPQRVNWLWRLVCELADMRTPEVLAGLHATGVAVDKQRVDSWSASDRDDNYFPMTIAEMERNLRSVLALRLAHAQAESEAIVAATPPD